MALYPAPLGIVLSCISVGCENILHNIFNAFLAVIFVSKLTFLPGFENRQYIFWPEATFPYPIFENSNWMNVLKNFVPINKDGNSALIFGA